MRVTPIQRYDNPRMPTHAILDEHPELLRLVPKRWQHNQAVLSALTALCVLSSGCRAIGGQNADAMRVAPIFRHGEGRGSFGCKAINPPVYFTEDEARQVIAEEAKRAGIVFGPGNKASGVRVPDKIGSKVTVPLELDGTDSKRGISFEFVSYSDAFASGPAPRASVYGVDAVGAANTLSAKLRKSSSTGTCAVFYEPFARHPISYSRDKGTAIDYRKGREEAEQKARQAGRELLRAQVRDFIKWLKAQGVI